MTGEQRQNIQTLIRQLTTAAATAGLYSLDHPQVDFLCRQALEHFSLALADGDEISLLRIEQELICDNQPLEPDMAVSRLFRVLQQQGIGHLKLRRGLPPAELLGLVDLLAQKSRLTTELHSTPHIRYGRVEAKTGSAAQAGETPDLLQQFPSLADLEKEEAAHFQQLYREVRAGKQLPIASLNSIVGSFVRILAAQSDPLLALAPLRKLDEYTYTHSTNVCILNIVQARLLGIQGQLLHDIGLAALLHDIGKLFVPQEILQKPGELNDREWQLIQAHPRLGAEYLVNTPGVPRLAVITAYEHHMRYDGAGYPRATRNWQQHLCSQMTTISDFFDALRTHRSYRVSMDFAKTARIMLEEAGTALHPLLVKNFLTALSHLDQSLDSAFAAE
jgi:HD-GYP domain-containing protein (c-di-GMP phosphodiesterase class II)